MNLPRRLSLVIAVSLGAFFGGALKFNQIRIWDGDVLPLYPKLWWLEAILLGAISGVLILFLSTLIYHKIKTLLSEKKLEKHFIALLFILVCQFFFNDFLSPRNWDNPLAATHKVESFTMGTTMPLYFGHYQNAKSYDFSNFSTLFWSGLPRALMNHDSVPIAFLTLLFDLPSASPEAYYTILLIYFFTFCCISSFAFYLFLQIEGFSFLSSLVGGTLFILSNRFFAVKLTQNFPMFAMPFLLFPAVLYFLARASKTQKKRDFALAGAVYSTQFYFFTSHPDSILHASLFICAYLLKCVWNEPKPFQGKLKAILSFGSAAALCGLYYLAPTLFNLFAKESFQWPHEDGITFYYGLYDGAKIILSSLATVFGPFLLLGIVLGKNAFKKQSSTFYFFLIVFLVLLVCFVPGNQGPFSLLLSSMNVRLFQFMRVERALMYVSFSGLFLTLAVLDMFYKSNPTKLSKVLSLAIFTLCLVGAVLKMNAFQSFYLGALVIFSLLILVARRAQANTSSAYLAISACTVFALLQEGSFEFKSPKLSRNPKNCRPYVSLQSILVSAESLPEDAPANIRNIQQRLLRFEKDSILDKGQLPLEYSTLLTSYSANSASQIPDAKILALAQSSAYDIDRFYYQDYSCHDSISNDANKDLWSKTYYDLQGLFEKIPDRFALIRSATRSLEHMGIGGGLHLIDNTTGVDNRFSTAFLPLNALYILPNHYFESVGTYTDPIAQNFGPEFIKNHSIRTRMNISGVSVFTLKKADWDSLSADDKQDFQVFLPHSSSPEVQSYLTVRDLRSYGSLYVARDVKFIPPLSDQLKKFRLPFPKSDPSVFSNYKTTVQNLENALGTLKGKKDILIETNTPKKPSPSIGEAEIRHWIGPRISSEVNCESPSCYVVLNQAALRGWAAFAGSRELPISVANFAFMAVEVPKGKHRLWFEWHPVYLSLALLVTLFSYVMILSLLFAKHHRLTR